MLAIVDGAKYASRGQWPLVTGHGENLDASVLKWGSRGADMEMSHGGTFTRHREVMLMAKFKAWTMKFAPTMTMVAIGLSIIGGGKKW